MSSPETNRLVDLLDSTNEPAYATDQNCRIVGWNEAAERLLGHHRESVLGRRCFRVLEGRDIFGNSYCQRECPLVKMARRRQPTSRFEIDLLTAGGRERFQSTVLVQYSTQESFLLLHLLTPVRSSEAKPGADHSGNDGGPHLTAREREIVKLLARDLDTREIAAALCISPNTVRKHVENVLVKLKVHSRVAAVARALEEGLL